ncbi:MAG: AAA family ATPase, partial [Anaerolineae bacterium]
MQSVYIATTQPYSGKSLVSLGITEMLLRRSNRVGVFRPVIGTDSPGERDKNIDLLLSHFNLGIRYEDTYALHRQEALDLVAHGRTDDLVDRIIEAYKVLEGQCDYIVCIGTDPEGGGAAAEFDLNADVARNLGVPVLIVASAGANPVGTVVASVRSSLDAFLGRG